MLAISEGKPQKYYRLVKSGDYQSRNSQPLKNFETRYSHVNIVFNLASFLFKPILGLAKTT